MKYLKKALSILLCIAMICACFAGCSSNKESKYSDTTLIIGYTEEVAPFLEIDENGNATGFEADLWNAIFDSIKGDLKNYVFEKVDAGYRLEEDGGFTGENGKEYSAGLLFGAVSKNKGTINEDYSFSEPIITDRVIAVASNNSDVVDFSSFDKAKAIVVGKTAKEAFERNSSIYNACATVKTVEKIDDALKMLDNGEADVLITNELTFNPTGKADNYNVLENYLDTIEYVIATAKYSGWKNSINEAIRELQSKDYGNGDEFTPIVEKYFGYNASSFVYETDGDK